jgi:hypothetical protein
MKKVHKNIVLMGIFLLLFLCMATTVRAQKYPYLKDVSVHCQVNIDTLNSMYFYKYGIYNHHSSVGKIYLLKIDVSLRSKISHPDTTGLKFQNDIIERVFRRIYPMIQGKVIPVGFTKSPPRWYGALTVSREATFGGYPLINPGDSLKGNTMMSRGLPSIRKFTAQPSFDVNKYFPSIEDTSANGMPIAIMDSIRNALNYSGFTIGPSLPPVPFSALVFSDTLMSYTSQACKLKWIDNKGHCQSLQAKLKSVQKQLGIGKTKVAITKLQDFLNEVKAQKGKHLTSEGYGLLYFNGEYLMQQLEKQ